MSYEPLIVFLGAIAGSVVQATTGFGCGIVLMLFLPSIFPLLQASAASVSICVVLAATIAVRYRHHVTAKKLILPCACYIITSTISIRISTGLDLRALSVAFGVFLILLAFYFVLGKGKVTLHTSPAIAVMAASASGVMGGLFGIGGPLMALYYLTSTDSKEEYIGILQSFFTISTTVATITRIYHGIYTLALLPMTLCGVVGVVIGGRIGSRILHRINAKMLTQLVYAIMGISGLITVMNQL